MAQAGDKQAADGYLHPGKLPGQSPPSTGGLAGSTRAGEPHGGDDSSEGGTDVPSEAAAPNEQHGHGSEALSEKQGQPEGGNEVKSATDAPERAPDTEVMGSKEGRDGGRRDGDDSDSYDDNVEPPEDDGIPPQANEAGAGLTAIESHMSYNQSHHSRPPSVALSRTVSRALTVVPRAQRRGLFGQFAILPEVERPYEYRNKTKWLITLVVSLTAAGGPLGSSIFYPALKELAIDLHTSDTVANLTIALYMLAMAIFPLWWSSFSETLGRRTIYLVSFSLFVVFSILSAVSKSIGMLIVMRVLGGGASASVQAVGAGTLADIWEPRERGRAMGIFYLGPLTGPLFAPIIGGALSSAWGWQSTMWFLTIFGGLTLLMLFFCLPETLSKNRRLPPELQTPPDADQPGADGAGAGGAALTPTPTAPLSRIATTTQSVRRHTRRAGLFLKYAFVQPLSVLLYLRFPPILLTVVYGAVTFGSLFVLNVSIQAAFSSPPYQFGELIVGLLYIPSSIGYILASLIGGRWIDSIMAREARKAGRYDARGRLVFLPEDRMRENAWLSASLFPAALIWFGWAVQHGVFWLVPSIANFVFGFGSMLVFGAVTTMLTEFMPRRSSGGIALNNFLRNIFSCTGAIVAQPLINALDYGWLCTMVALFALVVGNGCIFLLRRYGPKWRLDLDAQLNKLP